MGLLNKYPLGLCIVLEDPLKLQLKTELYVPLLKRARLLPS